jgi:hypothetical protein
MLRIGGYWLKAVNRNSVKRRTATQPEEHTTLPLASERSGGEGSQFIRGFNGLLLSAHARQVCPTDKQPLPHPSKEFNAKQDDTHAGAAIGEARARIQGKTQLRCFQ